MDERPYDQEYAGGTAQLSERRWQEWLWKNRERDKAGLARKLLLLKAALIILASAALIRNFMP